MADSADVRSLAELEVFHQEMQRLRVHLLKELEHLQVELHRLSKWLSEDALAYWGEQLTRSQRQLTECQQAVVRCMSYVREDERRPCTEEKKRLRRAEERRALCEQKLKVVKAATTTWDRENTKNHTKIQRCRDLAEADLVVAIQHLRGQIERLETYANLKSAAVSAPRSGPKSSRLMGESTLETDLPVESDENEREEGEIRETHQS